MIIHISNGLHGVEILRIFYVEKQICKQFGMTGLIKGNRTGGIIDVCFRNFGFIS